MNTTAEQKTTQKINLINGEYTASEALDIVNSVLKVKINFHKLNRLSITEGNNKDECVYDNGRINELMDAQKTTKEFLSQAQSSGKKIKMHGVIHIEIEE
ncbi:hypothetical protein [Pseudotamlana carrageenivorans]|uniref:Uncharacterized protein n=1 Tax=Pseudotamlana carrageenivorans TaxID=2069432 RepID=A0A2I7SFB7_9FLAO|nr:hypothetical protein [Tamlana carrageenivorans]AUS04609.1 hypothetical protein C1A40_03585 [Tamlana carrageenivorans]